jgi:hydrogenase maturation protease
MLLIIGYGNTLRSDDGVGPHVVREIAAQRLPDVTCVVVHQLTPEMAAQVTLADQVLFVDAQVDLQTYRARARPR